MARCRLLAQRLEGRRGSAAHAPSADAHLSVAGAPWHPTRPGAVAEAQHSRGRREHPPSGVAEPERLLQHHRCRAGGRIRNGVPASAHAGPVAVQADRRPGAGQDRAERAPIGGARAGRLLQCDEQWAAADRLGPAAIAPPEFALVLGGLGQWDRACGGPDAGCGGESAAGASGTAGSAGTDGRGAAPCGRRFGGIAQFEFELLRVGDGQRPEACGPDAGAGGAKSGIVR